MRGLRLCPTGCPIMPSRLVLPLNIYILQALYWHNHPKPLILSGCNLSLPSATPFITVQDIGCPNLLSPQCSTLGSGLSIEELVVIVGKEVTIPVSFE